MSSDVGDSYDRMAALYASLFMDALADDDTAVTWLETFAERAAAQHGRVVDLGCGPGYVVAHLRSLGVDAVGLDVSPGQVEQAHIAFPDLDISVGDLTSLEFPDGSLGGIVSRYSIIHLDPASLHDVFTEWHRVLEPGAPVLVSFFGSLTESAHGTPFDHKVTTAFELFPATIAALLIDTGFVEVDATAVPASRGSERPFDQATVFGRARSR
ncbi:MAG: class I SAM-dependent methyltransferase [Ilumatobacter sp.]